MSRQYTIGTEPFSGNRADLTTVTMSEHDGKGNVRQMVMRWIHGGTEYKTFPRLSVSEDSFSLLVSFADVLKEIAEFDVPSRGWNCDVMSVEQLCSILKSKGFTQK